MPFSECWGCGDGKARQGGVREGFDGVVGRIVACTRDISLVLDLLFDRGVSQRPEIRCDVRAAYYAGYWMLVQVADSPMHNGFA
jgi:hypothetical protein